MATIKHAEVKTQLREMIELLEEHGVLANGKTFYHHMNLRLSASDSRVASRGGLKMADVRVHDGDRIRMVRRPVPKISMALKPLARMAELDGYVPEYKSYKQDPEIGAVRTRDFGHAVLMILAHELSHAVQFAIRDRSPLAPDHRGTRAADLLNVADRRPHGPLFKGIYRVLRRYYVNPRHPDQAPMPVAAFPRSRVQLEDDAKPEPKEEPKSATKKTAAKRTAKKSTGGRKRSVPLESVTVPSDIPTPAQLGIDKSGTYIRELLRGNAEGNWKLADEQIARLVLANFEGRKTTVSDVGYQRSQLKKQGEEVARIFYDEL